jgi:hypothetical protein
VKRQIYTAFVYGTLYLLFPALPFVFVNGYGWNLGEEGLAFLALPVGGGIGAIVYIAFFNPRFVRASKAAAPKRPEPEARLEPVMPASILYALAFFIVAWTSFPRRAFLNLVSVCA